MLIVGGQNLMNGDRIKTKLNLRRDRPGEPAMAYTANPNSGRLRQEAVKLKASLGYALISRLT